VNIYHGGSRINTEKDKMVKDFGICIRNKSYPLLAKEGTKGWLINKFFILFYVCPESLAGGE
jgi:hypothetical protein